MLLTATSLVTCITRKKTTETLSFCSECCPNSYSRRVRSPRVVYRCTWWSFAGLVHRIFFGELRVRVPSFVLSTVTVTVTALRLRLLLAQFHDSRSRLCLQNFFIYLKSLRTIAVPVLYPGIHMCTYTQIYMCSAHYTNLNMPRSRTGPTNSIRVCTYTHIYMYIVQLFWLPTL